MVFMRSKCRSLLFTLSIVAGLIAFENGASPRFSALFLAPAQAKGASDSASAGEGEAQESGAKCSPGQGAASTSATRGHRFAGGFSRESGLGRMALDLSMLNLTEDQKNKIKTIRGRNAARAKELRQSLGANGGEFRGLIFSESATNDQITSKRDEMRPLKDELENLRLNDLLAIRGVLTSEQRKKWAESRPPEHKSHPRGGSAGDSETEKADKNAITGNGASLKVK
jgi:Spy/CpxP family protein refolding chaperone